MRHDLEILQELFLPQLEETATYSPVLADGLARSEAFWEYFNIVVLDGGTPLQELLTGYGAKDVAQYENLSAEYLSYMVQDYCAGQTNPTINWLLQTGDARFAAEVAFEKDILAAIVRAGRAALKTELEQAAEFAGTDVTDAEISAAFGAMHKDAAHDDLKKQLKQWDKDIPTTGKPAERKKYRAIPLLFFRFAAAAAVFTGGVVGVVKIYNNKNGDGTPPVHYSPGANQTSVSADTAAVAVTNQPNMAPGTPTQPGGAGAGSNNVGNRPTDSTASEHAVHMPHIVLKGSIADVQTGGTITEVLVTMQDDQGNKETVFSTDGTFSFDLTLHHDFVVTGKKEHYRSAQLSFSTKDVKETDADDVINALLRLEREP